MTYIRSAIGAVEIIAISDVTLDHPLPLERLFSSIPGNDWDGYRQQYPDSFSRAGGWRANMGCYLLRSQGKTILVDGGIGPAGGAVATVMEIPTGGRLLQVLESLGVLPEDIDMVIFTHLHRDHVGWSVRYDEGQPRLTFPRARYVVQQADWHTFQRPEMQEGLGSYLKQVVLPIKALGGLELIDGNYRITGEVSAIHTPGHTPGHMSIQISSGGKTAIITGDVVVNPAQIADAGGLFHFDMDRQAALLARHTLLDRIESEGIIAIGGHFPLPGMGRLVRQNGRRMWEATQGRACPPPGPVLE